jgi:hypothetical protein
VSNAPYSSAVAQAKRLGSESGFNSAAADSFAVDFTGKLTGISVPIDLPYRKVWAAFYSTGTSVDFFKGELRFLRYNSVLFTLPVAIVNTLAGAPAGLLVESIGGYFVSPGDKAIKDLLYIAKILPSGTNVQLACLPWTLYSECDEIEFHSLNAIMASTSNMAYIGCLSSLHNAF